MVFFCRQRRGFTLAEVIVVVAIIALLASVVFAGLGDARKESRDKKRMAEIDQIQLALRMYVDTNGASVDCDGGFVIDGQSSYTDADILSNPAGKLCNDRAEIFNFIKEYMGEVPHDPLGPGNKDYYYYFDPKHQCLGPTGTDPAPLLFAVNLESTDSNVLTQCTLQNGNDGGYQNTTDYTGTIGSSVPYVKRLDFFLHI